MRQLLLDKLSTRIHKLFVSTLGIAPIEGTIIKVKSTHQLHVVAECKLKLLYLWLKVGLNHKQLCKCPLNQCPCCQC